jgi:hypothetical protein
MNDVATTTSTYHLLQQVLIYTSSRLRVYIPLHSFHFTELQIEISPRVEVADENQP